MDEIDEMIMMMQFIINVIDKQIRHMNYFQRTLIRMIDKSEYEKLAGWGWK